MYQALYRKWRSRTFDQVVGQDHVTQTLKKQVQTGRLSHAYLFTGTRGTGKTSCAKLLARAVNCENPQDGNPCNECPSCRGILSGSIPDVLELDAASNSGVEDVRAILEEGAYTPGTVKKRVYIIDEVHALSPYAFNALLRTLEEPPAHLMFILATTEVHKVPATIKSRCQQFAFKRIHPDDIARHLLHIAGEEGIGLTPRGAELLARLANGGMRDALSLLDQCAGAEGPVDEARVLSSLGLAGNLEAAAILEAAANGDADDALSRLDRLYANGKEMNALAGELSALVRDLLVRRTAPRSGAALMTGGYDGETLARLSRRLDVPRLAQMLARLQRTAADLARSSNRRTDMELCLLALCDPSLDESLAALSARVARLEQGAPAPVRQWEQAAPEPVSAPAPEVKPVPKTEPEPVPEAVSAPEPVPTPEPAPEAVPAPVPEAVPAPAPEPAGEEIPWEEPPLPEEPDWDLPPLPDEPPPAREEPWAAEPVPRRKDPRPVPPRGEEPWPESPKPAPKPRPEPEPVPENLPGWPGWPAFRTRLKGMLNVSDYVFLGNPAMAEGRFDGRQLILWVANDFLKEQLGRPNIAQPITRLCREFTGAAALDIRVGQAPPEGASDPLEDFIARGGSNVIVE